MGNSAGMTAFYSRIINRSYRNRLIRVPVTIGKSQDNAITKVCTAIATHFRLRIRCDRDFHITGGLTA